MQMQQMGLDVRQLFNSDNVPMLRDNARPEAVTNLQRSLILQEIATKEGLEPSQEAIDAKIAEIRPELAGQDVDEDRLLEMVTSDLLNENTYKFLREKAQVELVPEGTLKQEEEAEAEEVTEADAEVASEDVSEATVEAEAVEVEVVTDGE